MLIAPVEVETDTVVRSIESNFLMNTTNVEEVSNGLTVTKDIGAIVTFSYPSFSVEDGLKQVLVATNTQVADSVGSEVSGTVFIEVL